MKVPRRRRLPASLGLAVGSGVLTVAVFAFCLATTRFLLPAVFLALVTPALLPTLLGALAPFRRSLPRSALWWCGVGAASGLVVASLYVYGWLLAGVLVR